MGGTILVERDGAIATVVLNNPERLNALDRAMWEGLGRAMRQLVAEDELRWPDLATLVAAVAAFMNPALLGVESRWRPKEWSWR